MEEFRSIVFRDGPTGRRAALIDGPDVWELIATLKVARRPGEEAVAATADLLNLTEPQVRSAVRYYDAFPEEIDRRIAVNTEEADKAEAAWRANDPSYSRIRRLRTPATGRLFSDPG